MQKRSELRILWDFTHTTIGTSALALSLGVVASFVLGPIGVDPLLAVGISAAVGGMYGTIVGDMNAKDKNVDTEYRHIPYYIAFFTTLFASLTFGAVYGQALILPFIVKHALALITSAGITTAVKSTGMLSTLKVA